MHVKLLILHIKKKKNHVYAYVSGGVKEFEFHL